MYHKVNRKRIMIVPMIKMEDMTTPYFRDDEMECTVVGMNYKGNKKAMFILPDKGKIKEASLQRP